MDNIKFFFWDMMEILSLAVLGLLAVKAVASLDIGRGRAQLVWPSWLKRLLYAGIVVLAIVGGWGIGHDLAAQRYASASQDDIAHRQYARSYENAMRAVNLRPASLRYWRALGVSKIALGQFASLLDDKPAFEALNGGDLDEEDAYRFALCQFYLGRYDESILVTRKLISENRFYAAPYVLQGLAYTAEKKYRDAQLSFLGVLQSFPTHQAAVEGLAHAYFLDGNRAGAVRVLDLTAQHPFPSDARKRFEALKGLYGH